MNKQQQRDKLLKSITSGDIFMVTFLEEGIPVEMSRDCDIFVAADCPKQVEDADLMYGYERMI